MQASEAVVTSSEPPVAIAEAVANPSVDEPEELVAPSEHVAAPFEGTVIPQRSTEHRLNVPFMSAYADDSFPREAALETSQVAAQSFNELYIPPNPSSDPFAFELPVTSQQDFHMSIQKLPNADLQRQSDPDLPPAYSELDDTPSKDAGSSSLAHAPSLDIQMELPQAGKSIAEALDTSEAGSEGIDHASDVPDRAPISGEDAGNFVELFVGYEAALCRVESLTRVRAEELRMLCAQIFVGLDGELQRRIEEAERAAARRELRAMLRRQGRNAYRVRSGSVRRI